MTKNIIGLVTLWNLLVMLILGVRMIAVWNNVLYLPDNILIALLISNSILTIGTVWVAFRFGKIEETDNNKIPT